MCSSADASTNFSLQFMSSVLVSALWRANNVSLAAKLAIILIAQWAPMNGERAKKQHSAPEREREKEPLNHCPSSGCAHRRRELMTQSIIYTIRRTASPTHTPWVNLFSLAPTRPASRVFLYFLSHQQSGSNSHPSPSVMTPGRIVLRLCRRLRRRRLISQRPGGAFCVICQPIHTNKVLSHYSRRVRSPSRFISSILCERRVFSTFLIYHNHTNIHLCVFACKHSAGLDFPE